MLRIIQTLMDRDDVSEPEANVIFNDFLDSVDYSDGMTVIEEQLMDDLGLEPDFMDEILERL